MTQDEKIAQIEDALDGIDVGDVWEYSLDLESRYANISPIQTFAEFELYERVCAYLRSVLPHDDVQSDLGRSVIALDARIMDYKAKGH